MLHFSLLNNNVNNCSVFSSGRVYQVSSLLATMLLSTTILQAYICVYFFRNFLSRVALKMNHILARLILTYMFR